MKSRMAIGNINPGEQEEQTPTPADSLSIWQSLILDNA